MPRPSADERAAAAWRAGGKAPAAPKHLGREAREVWVEIVNARPADYFVPGSLHLLERFCTITVQARRVDAQLEGADVGTPEYAELAGLATKYATSLGTLAQKLRLSIQSALRGESRKNEEREPAADTLLGGEAVWQGRDARKPN